MPKATADQGLPGKSNGSSASSRSGTNQARVSTHTASSQPSRMDNPCTYCKHEHYIAMCDSFRALELGQRKAFVQRNKLCFNCLGRHLMRDCRSNKSCKRCQGRHHSLLHMSNSQATADASGSLDATQDISVNTHFARRGPRRSILLATARIIVSASQRTMEVRALIDPCSEATFISEALAQQLHIPRQTALVPVTGVGGARCATAKHQASISIRPHFDNGKEWTVQALILKHLSDYVPPQYELIHQLAFSAGLKLADYNIKAADKVDVIIGADLFPMLIKGGLRRGPDSALIAQATELGWILTGATDSRLTAAQKSPTITSHSIGVDTELHELMERFWQQEDVAQVSTAFTKEEQECEEHFVATHRRDEHGRYIVQLPFKGDAAKLGDSKLVAQRTLRRMERRFAQQPQLGRMYENFMSEYTSLNHMSELRVFKEAACEQFYLPHHGVLKQNGDKSKQRVVFNGSVKVDNGATLNDCLHVGPKLQTEIFDIMLRWRKLRYVFSTDIEKMYRQILVDEHDRRFQQIYWRQTPTEEIKTYQLNTITYGLASSPYQAIRVLQQLASDESARYPAASRVLKNSAYMDDILTGADSLEDARELQRELADLLMAGGFPLSKWCANHPSLLESFPPEKLAGAREYNWNAGEAVSMLGISWQPHEDCFRFTIADPPTENITKRKALSFIGQLYDPLGWISPLTIQYKIFLQRLWTLGLSWDDPLPAHLQALWQSLVRDLQNLTQVCIPRWIGLSPTPGAVLELHGFADASERAYGAVIYVRTAVDDVRSRCTILTSKTKVAPLKQVSLPRLELCAAHMLVLLMRRVVDTMSMVDVPVHLWSDSTIALAWIRGHPTQWKTYVANRVSDIQTTLPQASWHHIAGTQNPADIASRGASVEALCSPSLWMDGPDMVASLNADRLRCISPAAGRRRMKC